jgi:hypothetical protein
VGILRNPVSLRPIHLISGVLGGLLLGVLIGRLSVADSAISATQRPPELPPVAEPQKLAVVPKPAPAPISAPEISAGTTQPAQSDPKNIQTAITWMNSQYTQLLKDPQIYAALRLRNARALESEFGAYIRAMHLTPAAKRKFLDIMADGMLSRIEANALEDAAGLPSQASLSKEVDMDQKSQLTALLGADGVKKLEFYSENQRAWKSTDAFARQLDEANVALSSDQHLAIITKLAEEKLKLTSNGAREVLAPLLNAEQLQQMDHYLADEELINRAKEIDDQLRKQSRQLINSPPRN